MPTYEYYCPACENVQDEIHGFTDDPKIVCTKCGGPCRRIMSGPMCAHSKSKTLPMFSLKGEGYPSKTFRVANQMTTRQRRTKKAGFELPERELIPNYEGEVTKDWDEAKHIAAVKGTPTEEDSSTRRSLTAEELKTFDERKKYDEKTKAEKTKTWEDVKHVRSKGGSHVAK